MAENKIVRGLKEAVRFAKGEETGARVTMYGETPEQLASRLAKARNCDHADLMFGSGGHFIFCCKCGGEWVASFNGGQVDYSRANNVVSGSDHRVPPKV